MDSNSDIPIGGIIGHDGIQIPPIVHDIIGKNKHRLDMDALMQDGRLLFNLKCLWPHECIHGFF